MARTELFAQYQVGGAFTVAGVDKHPNQILFVCSVNGTNAAGGGQNPDNPLATIDYAIGLCTASKGDVIYAMPGHTETITAAAGVALDVAGVSIIGLGEGRNRPVISYTTVAGASLDVSAANTRIENVRFSVVGVDAVTAAINVTAANFTLRNCQMELADATNQAVLGILTTANGTRLTVEGCYFHGTADAGTVAAIRIVGGDGHKILNNIFIGAYTTTLGAIDNVTTACTNTHVIGNTINALTASSAKAMVFVSTSTGQISNNRMQILTGSAPITGAAMSWVGGNYYAATIGAAGTLI